MLGKYDSTRDSALHFLCSEGWSNESFGDVSTFGRYVFRISNTWEDVKPENSEFNSLITDWVHSEDVRDTEDFYRSLVGHFLVTELSSGQVLVYSCETELQLISIFNTIQDQYNEFSETEEQE